MIAKKWNCQDNIEEIEYLSPWLLVILGDILLWSLSKKLAVNITSLMREMNDGISESKTHQEGRAFDLSVKGWTLEQIKELASYINLKYSAIGAKSAKDGSVNTCFYHNNGHGWHFHVQVRPIIKGVSVCLN
jgi:hypothetical protein